MLKKFKLKKKVVVIIIIAIALIAILLSVFGKTKEEEPTFEIVKIEKKTLTNSISGAGKIVAENSKAVTSQLMNYKVNSIKVKVGDKVNVGDVLCTFDTADLAKTVSDLEATIAVAGVVGGSSVTVTDIQVQQAENALNNTLGPIHDKVKEAEQAYQQLEVQKNNLKATITDKQNQAKVATDATQKSALEAQIATLQGQLNVVEQQYQAALAGHNELVKAYGDAASQLNPQVEMAKAQAESTKAQTSISSLSTEQQLNVYKKQLAETNLKSTVSGTVTSVNVKAGDYYTGGVLLTVEGEESLIVETEIDEYDIPDVKEGMEVIVKTDATRDAELLGTVTSVAPVATGSTANAASTSMSMLTGVGSATTSNSATYTVKISLNSQNERLRLGMNAKLNIITEKAENSLVVPYDAVYEKEDGTKYIIVINEDDSEEEITVTTGLESGYYTEISSDKIKEGMSVKMPKVDSTSTVDEILNAMGATGGI